MGGTGTQGHEGPIDADMSCLGFNHMYTYIQLHTSADPVDPGSVDGTQMCIGLQPFQQSCLGFDFSHYNFSSL